MPTLPRAAFTRTLCPFPKDRRCFGIGCHSDPLFQGRPLIPELTALPPWIPPVEFQVSFSSHLHILQVEFLQGLSAGSLLICSPLLPFPLVILMLSPCHNISPLTLSAAMLPPGSNFLFVTYPPESKQTHRSQAGRGRPQKLGIWENMIHDIFRDDWGIPRFLRGPHPAYYF